MIGIPVIHEVATPFFTSVLGLNFDDGNTYSFNVRTGSLVYASRNVIALDAINGGFDYLLFLDSDMVFDGDVLQRLSASVEGKDLVTGLAFTRQTPTQPVILKEIKYGGENELVYYTDYPQGSVFEIAGCGMACCIIRVDMIREIVEKLRQAPFDPLPGLSEDYSFCWRAAQIGKQLWCDSRIKVGHAGMYIYGEKDWRNQNGEV